MIDHSNKTIGTMTYSYVATWPEICTHKPRLAKMITTESGKRLIKRGASHRHYWWGLCSVCGVYRLVRSDRVEMYRCECNKPGEKRTCGKCHRSWPKTLSFWYVKKSGQFDNMCKICRKADTRNRYNPKRADKLLHYDRNMIGGNDEV